MRTFLACFIAIIGFVAGVYAGPVGTAFTYGGRLLDSANGNAPANGVYELQFQLFNSFINGTAVGQPYAVPPTAVTNGIFSVLVDFGADAFAPDEERWLEIAARKAGTGAPFETFTTRQRLTPVPYALRALSVVGGAGGAGWQLGGNAGVLPGQFLGTTDLQPLVLGVYNREALRFEPGNSPDYGANPPNIIGGYGTGMTGPFSYGSFIGNGYSITNGSPLSFIGVGTSLFIGTNSTWSFIGGGFDNSVGDNSSGSLIGGGENHRLQQSVGSLIVGGIQNTVTNSGGATVGGGEGNHVDSSDSSTIAGGGPNEILNSRNTTVSGGSVNKIHDSADATIGGGVANDIFSAYDSTIAGGYGNVINVAGGASAIGGGSYNVIGNGHDNVIYATIPGGYYNIATGPGSFAAGCFAAATNTGAFVWSDLAGSISDYFGSVTANEFAVRARGGIRFVTDGAGLTVDGFRITGAGSGSVSDHSVNATKLSAPSPAPGKILAVGSDGQSLVWVDASTGGQGGPPGWLLAGNMGTVAGQFLGTTDGQPLELRAGNQTALRLFAGSNQSGQTGINIVGGYAINSVALGVVGATISGGGLHDVDGTEHPNKVIGDYGTVAGGFDNFSGSAGATIGGGSRNSATDNYALVAGGLSNTAQGNSSTVGGGFKNIAGSANGLFATVAGGANNVADGQFASVPGGTLNVASGKGAFAAGYRARAILDGSFVWADSTDANFTSVSFDEFAVRAHGGVRFDTGGKGMLMDGVSLKPDGFGGISAVNTNVGIASNHAAFSGYDNDTRGVGILGYSDHGSGVSGFSSDGYAFHGYSDTGTGMISVGNTGTAIALQTTTGLLMRGYRNDPSTGVVEAFHVTADGTFSAKAFNTTSDRHAKKGFVPVDSQEVLRKVASMPISRWQFKDDDEVSHVGPMAQDFYAAFGLGQDNKHIATVDEEGVALAAIQGLNQKLEERDAEIRDLKRDLSEMKALLRQVLKQGDSNAGR